jgi:hypothetical protein
MEIVAVAVVLKEPTSPVACTPVGLITEALSTLTLGVTPVPTTPVGMILKSVEDITVPTSPTARVCKLTAAVAPASTDTSLTTAEPCTEPRVSPLWLPVTDAVPIAPLPTVPVATNSCSVVPKSEKAVAEYGEKPNMLHKPFHTD